MHAALGGMHKLTKPWKGDRKPTSRSHVHAPVVCQLAHASGSRLNSVNDFSGDEPRSLEINRDRAGNSTTRPLQGDEHVDNGNQGLRASHSRRPYPWLITDAPSGACPPRGIVARILRSIRSRPTAVNGYPGMERFFPRVLSNDQDQRVAS